MKYFIVVVGVDIFHVVDTNSGEVVSCFDYKYQADDEAKRLNAKI